MVGSKTNGAQSSGGPLGGPIMRQSWGDLLFIHWPLEEELLRPLIPRPLEIESFDGTAWIGVTPFRMWGVHPVYLPPLPWVSRSHEINVRTYVRLDGVSGIWFLSLDADNPLAVLGARVAYHLPYFLARMHLTEGGDTVRFTSLRLPGRRPAEFRGEWRLGEALPPSQPNSLEHFLTERYVLYTSWNHRLYRARIRHRPWPLRKAEVVHLASTMLQAHGLPPPQSPPLLHAQAEPLKVGIWPLERL